MCLRSPCVSLSLGFRPWLDFVIGAERDLDDEITAVSVAWYVKPSLFLSIFTCLVAFRIARNR